MNNIGFIGACKTNCTKLISSFLGLEANPLDVGVVTSKWVTNYYVLYFFSASSSCTIEYVLIVLILVKRVEVVVQNNVFNIFP